MLTILFNAALVLIGGYIAGELAAKIRMPKQLGMLVFGILMGRFGLGLLSDQFLELTPLMSTFALIVVIISSFFAIDIDILRKNISTVGLIDRHGARANGRLCHIDCGCLAVGL